MLQVPRQSRDTQDLMRNYMFLGQRVAKIDSQLADLSCVAPEIREFIGFIDCYNALNGVKEYQNERKALIKLGRAVWPRKELTDLSLRLGDTTIHVDFEEKNPESKEF